MSVSDILNKFANTGAGYENCYDNGVVGVTAPARPDNLPPAPTPPPQPSTPAFVARPLPAPTPAKNYDYCEIVEGLESSAKRVLNEKENDPIVDKLDEIIKLLTSIDRRLSRLDDTVDIIKRGMR